MPCNKDTIHDVFTSIFASCRFFVIFLRRKPYKITMGRYNHKHKWEWKDYFYRVAGVILTTAILVALMPRERFVSYDFHLGEPWDGEALIAKDSFPILKSAEQLTAERDSLMHLIEPYFQNNTEVADSQIAAFHKAFDSECQDINAPGLKTYLTKQLEDVYAHGIVPVNEFERMQQEGTRYLRIFEGQMAVVRSVKDVFSSKTAYEHLMATSDGNPYPASLISRCSMSRFIHPNLALDENKSEQQKQEVLSMLVPYMGQVMAGQKIIDKGDIVDQYTFAVLTSLEHHEKERSLTMEERLFRIAGHVFYVLGWTIMLLVFFLEFRSDYLEKWRYANLICLMYVAFPLTAYALVSYTSLSAYLIPFATVPIFVRIFMDSRTAFITHLVVVCVTCPIVPEPVIFVMTEAVAGLVAIYSLRDLTQRSELFRAMLLVLIASLVMNGSMNLLLGYCDDLRSVFFKDSITICGSAVLLLITYLLLFPVERMLGFTSSITLLELSNANTPLLRRLAEEAPGTFQHSIQVANLCAAVASQIGAKSQLVRTGALYHDIGKLHHPVFFTENQNGINPHTRLTNEQSAQIIISHVKEGLALAEKNRLPKVIKDFIATHHGTSVARFFYTQAINKNPGEEIDPGIFTYPGPNPSTAEQAILMMADSVEAASRSMKDVTEENINALVDKVVNAQLEAGYFKNCPITFNDIEAAKEVFKDKLRTIYHTRIQYPELKNKAQG